LTAEEGRPEQKRNTAAAAPDSQLKNAGSSCADGRVRGERRRAVLLGAKSARSRSRRSQKGEENPSTLLARATIPRHAHLEHRRLSRRSRVQARGPYPVARTCVTKLLPFGWIVDRPAGSVISRKNAGGHCHLDLALQRVAGAVRRQDDVNPPRVERASPSFAFCHQARKKSGRRHRRTAADDRPIRRPAGRGVRCQSGHQM